MGGTPVAIIPFHGIVHCKHLFWGTPFMETPRSASRLLATLCTVTRLSLLVQPPTQYKHNLSMADLRLDTLAMSTGPTKR